MNMEIGSLYQTENCSLLLFPTFEYACSFHAWQAQSNAVLYGLDLYLSRNPSVSKLNSNTVLVPLEKRQASVDRCYKVITQDGNIGWIVLIYHDIERMKKL